MAQQGALYNDPQYAMLGDLLNARAKIRFGALSHIITARILDSHPTCEELQKLMDDTEYLEKLFGYVAAEVLPGAASPVNNGLEPVKTQGLTSLPRSNSWSDLLKFERA